MCYLSTSMQFQKYSYETEQINAAYGCLLMKANRFNCSKVLEYVDPGN